ncbi:MAG: 2-oxoglutarate dehydrogenase E1 subunit family protein, partial [Phycisphaerales bacterium]
MAHEGPSSEGFRPHARQSLNGWQPEFVEAQYQRFLADPDSVGPEWKQFFLGFELGTAREPEAAASPSAAAAPSAPMPAVSVAPNAPADADQR